MIYGIGTDITEVARVEKAVARLGERFLRRVFTARERSFCGGRRDRWQCYAVRFAAKEAVLKALGTGLAGCRWTDVEIERGPSGGPAVLLSGGAAEIAREKGIDRVLISLSHEREHALAFAVAEKDDLDGGCQ